MKFSPTEKKFARYDLTGSSRLIYMLMPWLRKVFLPDFVLKNSIFSLLGVMHHFAGGRGEMGGKVPFLKYSTQIKIKI